jgi:hypothetical protein
MARGRPQKRTKYNISGLRNQQAGNCQLPCQSPGPNPDDMKGPPRLGKRTQPSESSPDDGDNSDSDSEWDLQSLDMDNVKDVEGCYEPSGNVVGEDETDFERREMWWNNQLESEQLCEMMLDMAAGGGDDPNDEDWLPPRLRLQRRRRESKKKGMHSPFCMQYDYNGSSARPQTYKRGPDVASKSERTRQRYRRQIATQGSLDKWLHAMAPLQSTPEHDVTPSPPEMQLEDNLPGHTPTSPEPHPHNQTPPDETESQQRAAADTDGADREPEGHGDEREDAEEWELEDDVQTSLPGVVESRGWDVLREQVRLDLKKFSKILPLSKINQLMIIRNFATLRLKGSGRIDASMQIAHQWHDGEGVWFARKIRELARHYQLYEQLPEEKRGGTKSTRTVFLDETVKSAARDYLTSQKTGEISPRQFQRALNDEILPALNISLKRPLCERTARRWLIKLGWRRTLLKKGVYMDGHEREDVVKYRNNVFLPAMAKYEARMTRYEGPDLTPVEPNLAPGEKKIIALFQDESCFHAHDNKSSAWYVCTVDNYVS